MAVDLRAVLEEHGQGHILRFWEDLSEEERRHLADQVLGIDFSLVEGLVEAWVHGAPSPESFAAIEPVPVLPVASMDRPGDREAWDAGEAALAEGRVGLVLVAGGQGTRLGFDGPKGAYPIGPVSGRSLFAFHAEKIHNLQGRYGCILPWYIMVGESNGAATVDFFREHDFFGLREQDLIFFKQRMMPCVSEEGRFFLESRHALAMNPNGHGGSIPAMVESGVTKNARARGVEVLSYFQVDNWAVKVADPFFIGHHVLRGGEFSSKAQRKHDVREPAGVFCLCDGKPGVIEYTEFDIYPDLLETDSQGEPLHFAANAAMHVLSVDFIERVSDAFDTFPWHCSHKKIPYLDEKGALVQPDGPNGYKFETFVFDALRFSGRDPVVLEIDRAGEFTPIKQPTGAGSVEAARAAMAAYWGDWLEEAGCPLPDGCEVSIEISPQFALTKEEFLEKTRGVVWPTHGHIAIDPRGRFL